jgi:hypothetical protein
VTSCTRACVTAPIGPWTAISATGVANSRVAHPVCNGSVPCTAQAIASSCPKHDRLNAPSWRLPRADTFRAFKPRRSGRSCTALILPESPRSRRTGNSRRALGAPGRFDVLPLRTPTHTCAYSASHRQRGFRQCDLGNQPAAQERGDTDAAGHEQPWARRGYRLANRPPNHAVRRWRDRSRLRRPPQRRRSRDAPSGDVWSSDTA